MTDRVSPKDRQLAEKLMLIWNECHDSEVIQADPSFAGFSGSLKDILLGLGMEWDTGHGYVFPWNNREKGPYPMSGVIAACSEQSLSTSHQWKAVGITQESPLVVRVVYVCERCSHWTYHEMNFVGYRMSNAQDRFDEAEDA